MLVKMKKSAKVLELKSKVIPTCCKDANYHQSPYKGEQVKQEFRSQPVHVAQHAELSPEEPEDRGTATAKMNCHHQPPDGCYRHPAETWQSNIKEESCYWCYGPNQCGKAESDNRDTARGKDEYNNQVQNDELELPLPLRSDDEWQFYSSSLPPQDYMHNYGEMFTPSTGHTVDISCYSTEGGKHHLYPVTSHWSTPCHHVQPWVDPQDCCRYHDCVNDSMAQGSVSVNVPQFSVPPVYGVSQVAVMNLSSAGAETSVSLSQETRRTMSLPDERRNIFITYSTDVSSEMGAFVDFLTKHGFRPAIDVFDTTIRCIDINKWKDSYLNDQSNLIIIAISPKYKADIEGSVVDNHGLHTKYIHSMMQNEFIQQGSLNFRFIPLLFLNASQEHVPRWLQNTCIYHWPQDAEDLLLRLLKQERYVPPAVPVELAFIIKPVAPSAAATM